MKHDKCPGSRAGRCRSGRTILSVNERSVRFFGLLFWLRAVKDARENGLLLLKLPFYVGKHGQRNVMGLKLLNF